MSAVYGYLLKNPDVKAALTVAHKALLSAFKRRQQGWMEDFAVPLFLTFGEADAVGEEADDEAVGEAAGEAAAGAVVEEGAAVVGDADAVAVGEVGEVVAAEGAAEGAMELEGADDDAGESSLESQADEFAKRFGSHQITAVYGYLLKNPDVEKALAVAHKALLAALKRRQQYFLEGNSKVAFDKGYASVRGAPPRDGRYKRGDYDTAEDAFASDRAHAESNGAFLFPPCPCSPSCPSHPRTPPTTVSRTHRRRDEEGRL